MFVYKKDVGSFWGRGKINYFLYLLNVVDNFCDLIIMVSDDLILLKI